MKVPKVSIIIATYNSEKTLDRALSSVLHQSFSDWECLIIDGVSRDNTVDIARKYVSLDKRFKCMSEPDSGIYDAFNKGWKLSQGDWIYYLGSDDEVTVNGIEDLFLQCSDEKNADVIYGNVIFRKTNGEESIHRHHSHKQLPWKTFASHQAVIMRRLIIESLGGFDQKLKILADKDLIIRSFLQANCNYFATESVVAVFSDGGASSVSWKSFKEDLYIYKKLNPGIKYLLYVIQHYPRMKMRSFFDNIF